MESSQPTKSTTITVSKTKPCLIILGRHFISCRLRSDESKSCFENRCRRRQCMEQVLPDGAGGSRGGSHRMSTHNRPSHAGLAGQLRNRPLNCFALSVRVRDEAGNTERIGLSTLLGHDRKRAHKPFFYPEEPIVHKYSPEMISETLSTRARESTQQSSFAISTFVYCSFLSLHVFPAAGSGAAARKLQQMTKSNKQKLACMSLSWS